MSELVDFPIRASLDIFAARKSLLVNEEHCNPDGTVMDFTGFTVSGQVRVAKDPTSTKLCDVSFANDLPNGKIYAYLTAANATAVRAGATETDAAGRKVAYCDIKAAAAGEEAEQWYVLKLYCENVVTP